MAAVVALVVRCVGGGLTSVGVRPSYYVFVDVVCPEYIQINGPNTAPGRTPGCYIQAINGIEMGSDIFIAPGVKIISANHNPDALDVHVPQDPIQIGSHCWIGVNAVILPGVSLGDHVIVGAGAVVTHSFPAHCTIAGVPAHIIQTQTGTEDSLTLQEQTNHDPAK